MRVESIVLATGQTVDVIDSAEIVPLAGVVLLHGFGTSERVSLRSLGASLAERGIVSVVPDWHPTAAGDSVSAALDRADDVFDRLGIEPEVRVVVGYSAGGRVALGLTIDAGARFARCVAIASSAFDDAAESEIGAERRVRVLLVHGDADEVRPLSVSEQLGSGLANAGIEARVVAIAGGTHANVVCAAFEPGLQLSNPAPDLTDPMRASVEAIARFVLT